MADNSDDEKSHFDIDDYDEAKESFYKEKFDKFIEKQKQKKMFLKKGEGKLASNFHGVTDYAKKRKEKVYDSQKKLEDDPIYINSPISYKYRK
jgi:hypothetical protein